MRKLYAGTTFLTLFCLSFVFLLVCPNPSFASNSSKKALEQKLKQLQKEFEKSKVQFKIFKQKVRKEIELPLSQAKQRLAQKSSDKKALEAMKRFKQKFQNAARQMTQQFDKLSQLKRKIRKLQRKISSSK